MGAEASGRTKTWWQQASVRWGLGLALFGLLERVWLWQNYEPISYGDTGAYLRLARVLARFAINGYDGTRVPGYPGFLALLKMNPESIWLVQMLLGWLIAVLLYWIALRTTESPALSALSAGLYHLIPGLFLFEANLLSETLTAFWAVLCFTMLVLLHQMRTPTAGMLVAFTLGVAASAIGMTRPLFFPMTLWVLPFVFLAAGKTWRTRFLYLGAYTLVPLLIQASWLYFIYDHYRMISPTTMGGYSLVQHTGAFFEYLPDEESTIRDIYLEYRDAQIAQRGVQTNAIWEAIPELTKETGHSFFMLSREMQRLSLELIREHPLRYLRSVLEGWIWFWKAPVYWRADLFGSGVGRTLLSVWSNIGRGISVISNAAFLLIASLVTLSKRARRWFALDRYTIFAGGLVLWTSVLQTLLDHGDNPRFLVPLQMMAIYVVLRSGFFALEHVERDSST